MAKSPGKTPFSEKGGATGGATKGENGPIDADLRVVIDAWPELPVGVKGDIVAMVRAAGAE